MRIAVALCTYNGASYLREQLRSIVTQTTLPDELVVTDDGSADNTMSILDEELRDVPFAVDSVRNAQTKGVAENFAFTLSRCTADVIALADQDDVWQRHRLARGTAPFADSEVTATFSDAALIDEGGRPQEPSLWDVHDIGGQSRRRLRRQATWRQLVRWNCVTGATLAIRRDILDVALPVPPDTLHDEWLALVAAGLGQVVAIEEQLVSYRVHGGSTLGLPPQGAVELAKARRDDVSTREREAARFDELSRRLSARGAADRASEALAKATFARDRAALAKQPHRRLAAVGRALAQRSYHHYAHGFRSAAHDLAFGA